MQYVLIISILLLIVIIWSFRKSKINKPTTTSVRPSEPEVELIKDQINNLLNSLKVEILVNDSGYANKDEPIEDAIIDVSGEGYYIPATSSNIEASNIL